MSWNGFSVCVLAMSREHGIVAFVCSYETRCMDNRTTLRRATTTCLSPASLARALAIVLFILGVGRLVAISSHSPLLAVANNYDQIRAMSYLGLSPRDSTVKFGEQSMSRPIRFFVQDRASERIYYSSEAELLRAALWFQKESISRGEVAAGLDVKVKGLVEVSVIAVAGLWLFLWFSQLGAGYALTFATAFVMWCDPVNSLFANSLYPEFFVSATLLFAVGGFARAACAE